MKTPSALDKAVENFQRLSSRQCEPFLNALPITESTRLRAKADCYLHTALNQPPEANDHPPAIWIANVVRNTLEDLLDELIGSFHPEREKKLGELRQAREQLRKWRATHRAVDSLQEPERAAYLLSEYSGCPFDEWVNVLGVQETKAALRAARNRIEMAARFEKEVFDLALSVYLSVWNPLYGKIPGGMICVVRDAVQFRLAKRDLPSREPSNFLPVESDRRTLRTYYLAFGNLFHEPRWRACTETLREWSDSKATKEAKGKLGLTQDARETRDWLRNSCRARLALRRTTDFVKGQEPVADTWYALVHDSGLTPPEVATLMSEEYQGVRAGNIEDMNDRYRSAIENWIAAHPTT